MEKKNKGFGAACKEAVRKFLVALKRKPQMIPLVVFVLAFLVYSLNLTKFSDTTAKIQGSGMGLYGFAVMLFSMLSLVCFNNAFPHRKPTNVPMLVLMYIMIAVIMICDIQYKGAIEYAITRPDNPLVITTSLAYIAKAYNLLTTHMIILVIGIVLTILLPVYSKWIRKIRTSIEVADNGDLGNIELAE